MFCELLSLLGLKVVPKDYQSIDKERVAVLLVMSKSWMNRIETVDDLFHDEISGQKKSLILKSLISAIRLLGIQLR